MSFQFQHYYVQAKPGDSIIEKKDAFFDQGWKLELVAKSINLYKIYQIGETRVAHAQIWDLYYKAKEDFELFEPCYYSNETEDRSGTSWGPDCTLGSSTDSATKNQYHWNKQKMGIMDPNLKELDTIPLPAGIPNAKRNGEGIYVAIPDTGYFKTRELIKDNPQFRPDLGWDVYCGDNEPLDSPKPPVPEPAHSAHTTNAGHGTSTACIVVGKHTPGVTAETKGLAKKSFVVPIRIDKGVFMKGNERIIRAIDYAINLGCKVISISMGYGAANGDSIMNGLLKHATEEGIITCSAAAQLYPDLALPGFVYPANSPYAIAVGGTDILNNYWAKSFRGRHISVAAPAEFVYRTGLDGPSNTLTFDRGCGTSFATPAVAAAAANWYALYTPQFLYNKYGKSFTHFAFRYILERHGVTKPAGWNTAEWGRGIINFIKLLSVQPQQLPSQQEIVDYTNRLINQHRDAEADDFLEYFHFDSIEDFNSEMTAVLQINRSPVSWLQEYRKELFYILDDIGYNAKAVNRQSLAEAIKAKGSDRLSAQVIQ